MANQRIGWRTYVPLMNSVDADATAFIAAAGITDLTQAAAISTLVNDLKTYGIWSKMKALYPFVGGTATSHKFNLKDPRDLDAAYRLVFSGGWVHSSTGALPNGTTGYADTFLAPINTLGLNSTHISYYSKTQTTEDNKTDIGCSSNTNELPIMQMYIRRSDSVYSDQYDYTNNRIIAPNTNTTGLFLATRTSNVLHKVYRNSTLLGTDTNLSTQNVLPGTFMTIAAYRRDMGVYRFSSKETAFASIGDGLSDTESTNFYNAVQKYQTTLGRQVNTPLVSDSDAQAFLNAAGITSYTQANAVNTLVVDLKSAGVWTKMKALYPFVGGNATSHKFNLKDPRDLDAAYRLTFSGGGTHTSNGYKGNGSNSYADSKFAANILSPGNAHLSFYNRTTTLGSGYVSAIQDNAAWNTNKTVSLGVGNANNGGVVGGYFAGGGANSTTVKNTAWTSLSLLTSTATNSHKVYNSGIVQGSSTTNSINTFSTSNLIIGAHAGALNYVGGYETAFVSFGDGLTDSDATSFDTAVQKFQTALGRHVDTPVYNNGLVLNLDAGNANSYPGTGTTWFDLAAGNNGTLVNGPTYDTTNGGSILFDGVNDYVNLGPNFRFNDTDITYDFWFKVTDNSDVYHEIITLGSSNQSNSISLWKWRSGSNSGKVFANINIVGITQTTLNSQLTGADILNTIVNYTAVFKKESGVYKLYLYRNGVLDASTTSNVTSYNMNNWANFEARIGSGSSTYPELWKGNIYSGKVYNRSLSATEILQNFNNMRGRFGL